MKKKILYNATYRKKILVVYGCNGESFRKFIKKNYREDPGPEASAGLFWSKEHKLVIWAGERKKLDMETFVHELCHACFYLLRYIELPVRQENDEAFAYLFESFYKQVC